MKRRGWTEIPLDRPVATLMILLCLTVLGSVAIFRIPIGFMPEVREPEVDIEIPFPGSHPLEGLRQVVEPIEDEVATIPGVEGVWAGAGSGNVNLEVSFGWGADVDVKKGEVREAVERARERLPSTVGHIRVEGDVDDGGEILGGRISAERDLSESWALLDRRIRRPLERVPGVARVNLYGVEAQQVRIDLDLTAIRRHNISIGEIVERIEAANVDLDLGAIRDDGLRYDVRAETALRDIEQARNIEVGPSGLRLADVADVRLREPILDYGRHLNRNFAIGFDVMGEPGANIVATVARLERKIEQIGRDPQLQGIEVLVWQNQGEEILNSIHGLRNAGIFGGLLAIVVLFLFLRRFATTLIVAMAIPFSLLVACGGLFLFGLEFDVLTMLGLMLGVGMLVDNAVVVVENIYRLQGEGMSARRAARVGPRQVGMAVLAATMTTMIVWSWLLVTEEGHIRTYMGAVALTICLSVACSLLISLTFIPLAAARFSGRRAPHRGFLLERVVPAYRRLLSWTLRHRTATILLLLALAGSSAYPIMMIEKSGEPAERRTDVSIQYRIHDGTTKEGIEAYVDQVEGWIASQRETLGYESLYSWFQAPANAVTRVYLPRNAKEPEYRALEAILREGLPTIPGVDLEIGDRRGHRGHGSRGVAVRVALHGEDPEFLEEIALDVERRMGELEHIVEVYGPSLVGSKELRVRIDPEAARRRQLNPQQIADAVGFAFRGRSLSRFNAADGQIEVIVGLPEQARPGVAALRTLQIINADGVSIPLDAVASVDQARTPDWINRWERRTTSWVSAEFDEEATTTEKSRDAVAAALADLTLPEGYAWDWGREHRDEDEALAIMFKGIGLALLIVVLLMMALFESVMQPLAILITLPLALLGAFWSLFLGGYDFELIGFMGVIILIGVVVNIGIVMVEQVNQLRRDGATRHAALLQGCGDRLRPVLMTVITTVVGLIPLGFSQFTVAGLYIDSLAVAMIGGLISSTVFTLIGLPVWYSAVEDLGKVIAGLLVAPFGRSGFPKTNP